MEQPALGQFLKDVENHQLTVNLDNGVYRDVTIANPNTMCMHYNITTRPGYLIFTGDMGSYVFSRTNDMFGFFRDKDIYEINPYYWSEKIQAGEYKRYSPQAARDALNQEFENWKEWLDEDVSQDFILEEKENLDAIDTDDYFELVEAIRNWCPNKGGVLLDDFWEHNLNEHTFHFIWCCYAIVHAIKLYDEYKLSEVA